ncbi:hypothetical protein NIES3275_74990 (plasmid) [Microchaete diplosiphon NIES-3275]|nr:hypothetical protein NIES3275_74990 [Microchaete diplosiphon NIES-3275]
MACFLREVRSETQQTPENVGLNAVLGHTLPHPPHLPHLPHLLKSSTSPPELNNLTTPSGELQKYSYLAIANAW